MSRILFVGALVAGWLLLWGDLSLANILSGTVLVGLLLVVLPTGRPDTGTLPLRPLALGRFAAAVLWDLVRSNLILARTILRWRPVLHSGVIAVEVHDCSPAMLAFIANTLGLSPGTMAVATSLHPPTVYVHVLQLGDADTARREVHALADRAVAAFSIDATPSHVHTDTPSEEPS
ncbi:MAG: Na+/H+ antiporter subunit E [Acidimicrobiales bacterium]|nr:Na+/H+ antiporter subunit E [Acidimicrobiales bacterium]